MRLTLSRWSVVGAVILVLSPGLASAQDLATRLAAGLASAERPAPEKARDASRRPAEVLEFLGIEPGMTVLDAVAAGGWYTEVLSVAVGPQGKVYSQNPPEMIERRGQAMIDAIHARASRLGNVEPLHENFDAMGLSNEVDAAITALNLHDMYNRQGDEGALIFLRGIYDALKPGGVLGLIDHIGVAGQDNAQLHRMEIADARRLLTEAGFAVEAESDLLRNRDDDHTLGVRDPAVTSKTDRMLFRARKPAT